MSTTIKALELEHFQQSMDLSQYAFQYSLTQEQLETYRETFMSDDQMKLGVFVNDQLCAQATLLHLHTYIAGQPFKMGGLAGVSTWPEHRRHGYVAKLLSELLHRMRNNGQSISMLHPFSFSFYRKFGWEGYVDHKKIELASEQLTAILKEQRNKQLPGQIIRLSNWQPLEQVYEAYAVRYNGMLKRSFNWWQKSIAKRKKGNCAAFRDEHGILQGYILYEVANRQMSIHEFICLTSVAEQALLTYIAQHDSMVDKVSWITQAEDPVFFGLDNPRIKQELTPYFMARIVDIEAFILQFPFEPANCEEQYTIAITDQHAVWNQGTFVLTINKDGRAAIHLSSDKIEPQISISIGGLTAWLLNYQTCNNLERFGKLCGEHNILKRLQKRIPANQTYLTDFF